MRRLVGFLLVLAAAAGQVEAGSRYSYQVAIDTTARAASGALGTVRNTTDPVQTIGCYVHTRRGGYTVAVCSARNSAGYFVSCPTTDAALIAAARSLQGDSYLRFNWDESNECTEIYVASRSSIEPKQ